MANGLKNLATNVMRETGYSPPSTFIGNTGQDARRMVAIVNRAGRQLSRMVWQYLVRDATVSISGTAIYSLPADFYQFISNTGWNNTGTDPLVGPVTNQEWQYFRNAVASTGIYYRFRIFVQVAASGPVQRLQVDPVNSATAISFVFNYHTDHWVASASATTTTAWVGETQDPTVDSQLLELSVRWRWLKSKGLPYAEEFEEFRRALNRERARDGGQGSKLSMDAQYVTDVPNIPDTGVGL
jgi:hypothetical protein